ncbi:hypothetical protein C8035_v002456 [Colletotrichum spinosum]|uniref:Uncharacterized protein n=1 Tax=Colletotrichum spinosum TaxID=1347390 RepID=A0A4R8PX53_9PEZI|nr:hypothetical protein C8035_v002456 [Colletotrichum spinosum]
MVVKDQPRPVVHSMQPDAEAARKEERGEKEKKHWSCAQCCSSCLDCIVMCFRA